jgi:hypothetical protein
MAGEKSLSTWVMDLMFDDRRQRAVKVLAEVRDRCVNEWAEKGNREVCYNAYEQMIGRVGKQDLDADAYVEILCDLLFVAHTEYTRTLHKMWSEPSMAASQVLEALSADVIRNPSVIRRLMADDVQWYIAARILKKEGPAARSFVDDLLRRLDEGGRTRWGFDMPDVRAVVARGDKGLIERICQRVEDERPWARVGACQTLQRIGPSVVEAVPSIIECLLALTHSQNREDRSSAALALGYLTRSTNVVLDRVLEMTRDEDSEVAGTAIQALGEIVCCPERVVPRLIELLDEYKEEDEDWEFSGRVSGALAAFGAAAAPAVPAVLSKIRPDGVDRRMLELLETIGPPAAAALPKLEEMAAKQNHEFLDRAIASIRGHPFPKKPEREWD